MVKNSTVKLDIKAVKKLKDLLKKEKNTKNKSLPFNSPFDLISFLKVMEVFLQRVNRKQQLDEKESDKAEEIEGSTQVEA